MVILISAPSCSGKTLLAQQLLEKHKMPYYSIDHIKMGLIRGLDAIGFTAESSDDHISEKIWPIIKGIIMTAIENHQNVIIEGAYIKPEYLLEFDAHYKKHIVPIFLCFSQTYINHHYESRILGHRNVIENRLYNETRDITFFLESHERLINACLLNKQTFFLVDDSYEKTISDIHEYVESKLRET